MAELRHISTRERLEMELMDRLASAKAAWLAANPEDRNRARSAFYDALRTFDELVIHNKLPTEKTEPFLSPSAP